MASGSRIRVAGCPASQNNGVCGTWFVNQPLSSPTYAACENGKANTATGFPVYTLKNAIGENLFGYTYIDANSSAVYAVIAATHCVPPDEMTTRYVASFSSVQFGLPFGTTFGRATNFSAVNGSPPAVLTLASLSGNTPPSPPVPPSPLPPWPSPPKPPLPPRPPPPPPKTVVWYEQNMVALAGSGVAALAFLCWCVGVFFICMHYNMFQCKQRKTRKT